VSNLIYELQINTSGVTIKNEKIKSSKKIKPIEKIIGDLYSYTKKNTWYYYTIENNGDHKVVSGYTNTPQATVVWYNYSFLQVPDPWKDIRNVFSFCGINWHDHFHKVSLDRVNAVADITSLSAIYFGDYQKRANAVGELGEVIAGYLQDLWITKSNITAGYDALDVNFERVQIKTITMPSNRCGKFSGHDYDYALIVLLHQDLTLKTICKNHRPSLNKKGQTTVNKLLKSASSNFTYNPQGYIHIKFGIT
jgi:hypothetical protein